MLLEKLDKFNKEKDKKATTHKVSDQLKVN